MGLAVWCEDEAGPYQAIPPPGYHWQDVNHPYRYPHEHIRGGTAKLLTLFHPKDGKLKVKGVCRSTNEIIHPWLKTELSKIIKRLPAQNTQRNKSNWTKWQQGLKIKFTLRQRPPALKMLLIMDNLVGHKNGDFVNWMVDHGIMPLYTPVAGSWLNMAESIQNILVQRGLSGNHPRTNTEIIEWLEATAKGWNRNPTPFVWGGARALRRKRSRLRQHALGKSGACTRKPVKKLKYMKGHEHSE